MFRINKAHPWHGIPIGEKVPEEVTVFIEIVPRDTVKYEVDKETGYLKINRPQQYSNVVPANYGFIPQTYCRLSRFARKAQVNLRLDSRVINKLRGFRVEFENIDRLDGVAVFVDLHNFSRDAREIFCLRDCVAQSIAVGRAGAANCIRQNINRIVSQ